MKKKHHQERQEKCQNEKIPLTMRVDAWLCWGSVRCMGKAQSQATGPARAACERCSRSNRSQSHVTATNNGNRLARSSTSNDEGYYAILLLPPGMYNVAAEASGFAASTISDVEVSVGRTRDINITMGVSGVQEVVSVTAAAIQVQTSRSEADSVLNQQATRISRSTVADSRTSLR